MPTQLEPTRRQLVALAKQERGTKTREEFFGDFDGMSFNTYANFESGHNWPRTGTLRALERLLGWQAGIIDAVIALEVPPAMLTLDHMHGKIPLAPPSSSLADYPSSALLAEMMRREFEYEAYRLASSQGGEDGIGPEDAPDE